MAVRERAVHTNYNPTLLITELSPINLFFIMVAYPAISWKVLKGLKLNCVHTQVLMKGSTEDKNHNPILHFTLLTFFIKK